MRWFILPAPGLSGEHSWVSPEVARGPSTCGLPHPLGTWVDCFIGDCYDFPWLIDRLYILGFVPLMVGHHSIHALKILGHLETHNMHQR
jgi:hypothetical protein